MEKKHRKKAMGGIDIPFLTIMLIMLVFGLIMVFSASAPSAFYKQGDQLYYIKRQLIWTVLGFVAMGAASCVSYKLVKRYASLMFGAAIILLLLVLVMGSVGGGAQRWLELGPIRFQPSEFAKFALVFFFGLCHGIPCTVSIIDVINSLNLAIDITMVGDSEMR